MNTQHPNNLKTSAKGLELIKRHEGLRLNVYLCPAGKPTIGYGYLLTKSEQGVLNTITRAQADALLANDVRIAEMYINANVRVLLTQYQFDALVSFAFNLGVGALDKSTLLKRLNAGATLAASTEFGKWNKLRNPKTKQLEVSNGLTKRRLDEMHLFMGRV